MYQTGKYLLYLLYIYCISIQYTLLNIIYTISYQTGKSEPDAPLLVGDEESNFAQNEAVVICCGWANKQAAGKWLL